MGRLGDADKLHMAGPRPGEGADEIVAIDGRFEPIAAAWSHVLQRGTEVGLVGVVRMGARTVHAEQAVRSHRPDPEGRGAVVSQQPSANPEALADQVAAVLAWCLWGGANRRGDDQSDGDQQGAQARVQSAPYMTRSPCANWETGADVHS